MTDGQKAPWPPWGRDQQYLPASHQEPPCSSHQPSSQQAWPPCEWRWAGGCQSLGGFRRSFVLLKKHHQQNCWRKCSVKLIRFCQKPVVAGYRRDSFSLLSGPMMNTALRGMDVETLEENCQHDQAKEGKCYAKGTTCRWGECPWHLSHQGPSFRTEWPPWIIN